MTGVAAVAAWLQPALVVALAFRVTAGAPDAPWLALAALVAPLVALLASARPPSRNPVVAGAVAVTVTLLLAADLLVAADAATLLGMPRWLGAALAALPALALTAWAPARRMWPAALAVAAAALLLGPAAVALAAGGAPWTAWQRSGLRPALTFAAQSPWVLAGERFARAATLRFSEGQRVVTLAAGVFRVVERDAATPTVREWRLAAGDALALRPGDELTVEAGARLRFEAGRRVPGAPASGVEWADAPARGPRLLPLALGALVTLLGGALALVPPARGRAAAAGPLVLLAATSAALAWGVYAATAPDVVLGGALPAPLLRLPTAALGPVGVPLAALTGLALILLLAAAAAALRERLAVSVSAGPEVWTGAVVVAAALAMSPLDPWRVLMLALGLAAAAWAPARLATSSAGALAGPIVGGVAFLALAGLPTFAPGAPAWLDALARYPALVAFPLGWLAARAMPPDGAREAPGG